MSNITDNTINNITDMMPFLEPITYHSRGGGANADTYATFKIAKARPRRLNKKDADIAPDLLQKTDKVFELYSNYLNAAGAPIPKKDDYITDKENRNWTIFEVRESFHENCWNVFCVKRV